MQRRVWRCPGCRPPHTWAHLNTRMCMRMRTWDLCTRICKRIHTGAGCMRQSCMTRAANNMSPLLGGSPRTGKACTRRPRSLWLCRRSCRRSCKRRCWSSCARRGWSYTRTGRPGLCYTECRWNHDGGHGRGPRSKRCGVHMGMSCTRSPSLRL